MPWSPLPCLALAALALWPAAAPAQPLTYRPEIRRGEDPALVNRLDARLGNLYAGAEAGLLHGDAYHLTYRFALGVRPSLGRTEMDLRVDYRLPGLADPGDPHGTVTFDLARPLGERLRIETWFRLDPEASIVAMENDLIVRISETFAITGTDRRDIAYDGDEDGTPLYRIGAARAMGSTGTLKVDYGARGDVERLTLDYQLRF